MNIRVLAEALADKVDDRQSQELLDHPSFTRDGFIKMFEEVILAHVLAILWTKEKPAQPGWYWTRWRGTLEVVKVAWNKDNKGTLIDQAILCSVHYRTNSMTNMNGLDRWCRRRDDGYRSAITDSSLDGLTRWDNRAVCRMAGIHLQPW